MFQVVKAQSKHIPEIMGLCNELMDFHEARDPEITRGKNYHYKLEENLRKIMSSRNSRIFIAVDREKVVGYSLIAISNYPPVFKQKPFGFISDVAVKKEYRRQGVGGILLKEIKKWFTKKRIKRITIRVLSKNEVGLPFWQKQGFEEYMKTMYLEI